MDGIALDLGDAPIEVDLSFDGMRICARYSGFETYYPRNIGGTLPCAYSYVAGLIAGALGGEVKEVRLNPRGITAIIEIKKG